VVLTRKAIDLLAVAVYPAVPKQARMGRLLLRLNSSSSVRLVSCHVPASISLLMASCAAPNVILQGEYNPRLAQPSAQDRENRLPRGFKSIDCLEVKGFPGCDSVLHAAFLISRSDLAVGAWDPPSPSGFLKRMLPGEGLENARSSVTGIPLFFAKRTPFLTSLLGFSG
jgi:hypothetical protein